jgi:hypothetical protein
MRGHERPKGVRNINDSNEEAVKRDQVSLFFIVCNFIRGLLKKAV